MAVDPVMPWLEWLVVVGSMAAFAYGFGTGSNDVANAFGTSVGAKTLTLRQAVLIAAVFEFTGALVLGRVSTSVIASGIADLNAFKSAPEFLAYGMVCAMTISAFWQILASYFELNVSSTHSIIGSIMGFALIYGGSSAVKWLTPDPASFPPYKGVVPIILSWFFSPILTALASAILFIIIRTTVLRRKNSYNMSFWLLPIFVVLTVWISMYFVFTKGAKKALSADDWDDAKAAWVSAIIAAGCGFLTAAIALPLLRYRSKRMFNEDGTIKEKEVAPKAVEKDPEAGSSGSDTGDNVAKDQLEPGASLPVPAADDWKSRTKRSFSEGLNKVGKALMHGTSVDIHAVVEEDELIKAIHAHAEVFDPKAEYVFKYLQVFSACCVVFSHGAGEVGYMAGPLAAIWAIYTTGTITSSVTAPIWAVLIGALGLVIGLATYGYNVTRAMGVRLSKLTATRGFCAELSTALVIMVASQFGLPTSSSQCITGGIIGVGLCEGRVGVNWKFFAKQFASWVATLFVSGLCTAALFAQGVYAPGIQEAGVVAYYEKAVSTTAQAMLVNYQTSMNSYAAASSANVIPRLPPATLAAWNTALNTTANAAKAATTASYVNQATVMSYLQTALSLYQFDSVLTVGQVEVYPGAVVCNNNVTADITAGVNVACPAPKLLPTGVASTWPPATA